LAVKAGEVATPLVLVVIVVESVPLGKVPPAPAPGAVNDTTAPDTGVPFVVTVTESGDANGWLSVVFCTKGLMAVTVVIAAGVTVAGVELQPVRKARARKIEAGTHQ
jgi:hypothetical protein